jgi:hypothetical protein
MELISEYTSINSSSLSSSSSSSSSLMSELETRKRYYPQNIYQTNFRKYPLLLVTCQTYMRDIKQFILNQLKDLQSENSDNDESNHRIVAVFNLQCFLFNVGKPIGGKQGMKSLVFDFVKNCFASTITEYPLCWCFFNFYGYQNLSEEEKELKLKKYKGFVLATEIEKTS